MIMNFMPLINVTSINVSAMTTLQTIPLPTNYDMITTVYVNAVTHTIDPDITSGNIRSGISILDITGTYIPTVVCPTCQNCDSCDYCDYCEYCDTCQNCNSCETCDVCESCQNCDTACEAYCQSCDTCDYCDTCDVCEGCDYCDTGEEPCDICDGYYEESCGETMN